MKNILITGSNGFIGKYLQKYMQIDGFNILFGTTSTPCSDSRCCIVFSNLYSDIEKKLESVDIDIIIHLAGITGNIECEKDPHKTLETNVMGTYYILDAIKNKKIRLIFASSREVYGYSKNKVNENSPLQPINLNGITKMFSENLIINFHLKYKIGFNILRFTNFYGEHNEKRGISKMIKNSLKGKKIIIFGGSQSIDLIHFDDAVNAIIKTIEAKRNGIFNIGYGKSIKLLSLIDTLEKISKTKINFNLEKSRNIEVQKFALDVSKAKRELGFEAKISPKIAIKRMVTKWKKN